MEFMDIHATCEDHLKHCLRCMLRRADHLDPVLAGQFCQYCGTCGDFAASKGKALKKCGGCGIAAYCSRECQKKDWKVLHKASCRSDRTGARGPHGDEVEKNGFSSRMALFDALSNWMRVHESTLIFIANTMASMCDIKDLLQSHSRVLLIRLCPHHDSPVPFDGNPALEFRFVSMHPVSREELGRTMCHGYSLYDQIVEGGRRAMERERTEILSAVDSGAVIGVLPVFFAIPCCKFLHNAFYGLHRRRYGIHPMGGGRQKILTALVELLIEMIGEGHVLNGSSLCGPLPVLVGDMVEVKKKWKWEQIEWHWDTVLEDRIGKTGSPIPWREALKLEAWG